MNGFPADAPDHYVVTSSSFTKGVYRDVYPTVDPKSPRLSQAGKVILITGASRGIGKYGFATAFAQANAKALILTARDVKSLDETVAAVKKINPEIEVLPLSMNIADRTSINAAFEKIKTQFGTIDVLVNNAGVFNARGKTSNEADFDVDDWFSNLETNVKGTMNVTTAFLSLIGKEKHATVINVTSGAAVLVWPGFSGYALSKLVNVQQSTYLALENPNLISISLHPGMVATDMKLDGMDYFTKDTPELAGGVGVWLASDEAKWLNGRYMSVNWDVEEVLQRKDEILQNDYFKVTFKGVFGPAELKG